MLVRSHGEEPLWFVDALEFVFATVFERDACRSACQIANCGRDEYLTCRSHALNPCRELHSPATNVVLFMNHVASVDSQMEW